MLTIHPSLPVLSSNWHMGCSFQYNRICSSNVMDKSVAFLWPTMSFGERNLDIVQELVSSRIQQKA